MKTFLTILAVVCFISSGRGAGVTPTVKAGGLAIAETDFIMTNKTTYIHLLWDAFPSKAILPSNPGKAGLVREAVVIDLVKGPVLARFKDATSVKIDVVEFPERDSYGAPVWGSVKKLARFQASIGKKKKVTLKSVPK